MRAPRWAQQQLLFIRKAGRALAGSLTTGGGPLTRAYGPAPPALHGLSATAAHHATAARTRNFATRIGGIPAAAPGAANRPPPSPPRGANMLQRRSSGCSSEPAAACSATQRPAIPAMHHPSSRRLLHMRPSATAHRHHPHALASSPPLPLGGVGHHGRRWWAAAVPALGVLRPAPPAAAATMASVASAARAAAGKADASEGLQAPEEAETYWREVLDGMKRYGGQNGAVFWRLDGRVGPAAAVQRSRGGRQRPILHQRNGPPPASCRKDQQGGRLGTSPGLCVTQPQAASGGTAERRRTPARSRKGQKAEREGRERKGRYVGGGRRGSGSELGATSEAQCVLIGDPGTPAAVVPCARRVLLQLDEVGDASTAGLPLVAAPKGRAASFALCAPLVVPPVSAMARAAVDAVHERTDLEQRQEDALHAPAAGVWGERSMARGSV